MVKTTRIVCDAKTGKQWTEEIDLPPQTPSPPMPKGIDLEKLKVVLLKRRIIRDASEIE